MGFLRRINRLFLCDLRVKSPDAEYTFKVRTINGTNASDEITATDDTNPDQPEIRTIGVEARYSSNNIRFGAVENATSYELLKSEAEEGNYTTVTTVDAVEDQEAYSYVIPLQEPEPSAGIRLWLWLKMGTLRSDPHRIHIRPV